MAVGPKSRPLGDGRLVIGDKITEAASASPAAVLMNKVTIDRGENPNDYMAATYNHFAAWGERKNSSLRTPRGWYDHLDRTTLCSPEATAGRWTPGEEHGSAIFQHASPFYSVSKWGGATVGGSSDGSLFTAEGSDVRQFDVHQGPVLALGTTCGGLHASGDANGLVCLWAAEGGRLDMQRACPTSFGKIRHIAPHPDGLLLATGSGRRGDVGRRQGRFTVQAYARSAYWASVHPTNRSR